MNNIFVYCEVKDDGSIADVSLELCSKARHLADTLGVDVNAIVIGSDLNGLEESLYNHGVNTVFRVDDKRFAVYQTLPHFAVVTKILESEKPYAVLFGATNNGRDLAPRIASYLRCGLTADCTALDIDEEGNLMQIRPAFGGNIIATIISPDVRPQMATVREGVMKKEMCARQSNCSVVDINADDYVSESDFVVEIIERHLEERNIDIKGASIIVSGGYGMKSKENFQLLHELAGLLGGEVGATRAAVDAGFAESARQVGQTGVTVRPKVYIACGISGAVQHRAGMEQSALIISINTDANAPINSIADYVIVGDAVDVVGKMIKYLKNK
ncbi:MAG: electron transfer flavoprotein subunit alpha/FixB family protein [Candidatus Limimorpha sp.]|nr:electron transfer flavoprotein subunit alpha/FixB family protein [Bacteroidales bacterium]MDD5978495.1 electron transfer flavoprotein subunit alpha/FixB family protein [Bacteroidales bacterium]MDD7277277.1 electron transfer flavoprotein subunit alpha/FixB family protein [Bacteroidales bacterium]MDY6075075.1 electron transfer flavoprotein subunit alpha/FixB family protein [Bacteroidales bacterium]